MSHGSWSGAISSHAIRIHVLIISFASLYRFFFPFRALKDQGYESDSTLVFRKRDTPYIAPLSPVEQKQAYLNMQAGGEAPIQGFRKPAPEKPRGMCVCCNSFLCRKSI